jgi:hypothetical protein
MINKDVERNVKEEEKRTSPFYFSVGVIIIFPGGISTA